MPAIRFLANSPVLVVSDVLASVAFYRDKLGFEQINQWGDPPCFAIATRGQVSVFLDERRGSDPIPNNQYWAAYIYVDDVDALHADYTSKGLEIIRGPETTHYGCRDFDIRDPDGHVIGFGQDLG